MSFAQITQSLDAAKKALLAQANKVLELVEKAKADQYKAKEHILSAASETLGLFSVAINHGVSLPASTNQAITATSNKLMGALAAKDHAELVKVAEGAVSELRQWVKNTH